MVKRPGRESAGTLVLLALVALERLRELVQSRRNSRALRAAGAREHGQRHLPWMVGLHVLFFVSCALESVLRRGRRVGLALRAAGIAATLAAQALRLSAMRALGRRWSIRILVLPGAPPVTSGPYRHLRHPNYLAVLIEGVALPLAGGCWRTAIGFTAGNAIVLAARIRAEEHALGPAYAALFATRPRFVARPQATPPPELVAIREIAARELGLTRPIRARDELLADLGLDSLALLTLVVGLEDRFGVVLPPLETLDVLTVRDLVVRLAQARAQRSSSGAGGS
jgi:methyltransferase